MDEATKKKVEETVLEILRGSDMESVTEYKVRSAAADRLGIDLSASDRKLFVRGVVEGYLSSLSSQEAEEEQQQQGRDGEEAKGGEGEVDEEEEEEEEEGGARKREYDDNGDLILCRVSSSFRALLRPLLDRSRSRVLWRDVGLRVQLSSKRRVTLSEFKGKTLVSIREFYLKDGKELPSSKGDDSDLPRAATFLIIARMIAVMRSTQNGF
jgi:hypothetical protein